MIEANTEEELRIASEKISERNIAAVVFGASQHFQVISDKFPLPQVIAFQRFTNGVSLSRTEYASLIGTDVF
jgi:hypothetical protein